MDTRQILNRQTDHLKGTGEAEVNRFLLTVADAFGVNWLERQPEHPVGALFHRKDALASTQLALLGAALASGHEADPKWLARQVKTMKGKDPGERRGAMFEIVARHMLAPPGRITTPTGKGFPGYDTIIRYPDGARLAVSLKNYAVSAHERAFVRDARKAEQAFVETLRRTGLNGLVLGAVAANLPQAADWKTLIESMPDLVMHSVARGEPGVWTRGNWGVTVRDAPVDVRPLSSTNLSYQIFAAAPFHTNEQKNLLDRLEEAAANAREHAARDPELARAVLVRIGEHIPVDACVSWAEEYLAGHPDGPVDLIILYQLAVVDGADGSVLQHAIVCRWARSYERWRAPGRQLALNITFGVASEKGSVMGFADFPNVPFERMYVHQSGEFYRLFTQAPDGSCGGNVRTLASGISQKAIIRLPDGGELAVSGLFPPTNAITLFD